MLRLTSLWALFVLLAGVSRADVTRVIELTPGTPAEAEAYLSGVGTSVEKDARKGAAGAHWTYRVVVPPEARCILSFAAEGDPVVTVAGSDGKPIQSRTERSEGGVRYTVYATAPQNHPIGAAMRFQFKAGAAPVSIRELKATLRMQDRNGDGISDAVARMMGVGPNDKLAVTPRPGRPQTSFQTGDAYATTIGIPTDAVLAYTAAQDRIETWSAKGYVPQTMGGFRAGPDYVKDHPGEVQRDASGSQITIGGDSYYMIPTQARIDIAKQYYQSALNAGSMAVCPEEPEIFARAGWSEAFKQEWQARYGAAWEPPNGSIEARYKAEQLKAFLTQRQIESILTDAERVKPGATRMVAIHSPVTYYQWGITVPHYALLQIPSLQEIIGQVWTGTARSPARAAGVRAERTFEVGFLEYSSLYNLARGSGKRMWFLMDPVEDNPNRSAADYKANYEQTLVAALMFPDVFNYEVMPWPSRVYGHVAGTYATQINTAVGALADLWRYQGELEAGSAGIGTFVSDSMGFQRADPAPSDYDGFYGLSLPLLMHGVPVQVLSLDRAGEPGYLDKFKTLLLSYDFLKPSSPDLNKALAGWVYNGGTLVLFGGTDAYNALSDSWWRKAGYSSPVESLFMLMGHDIRNPKTFAVEKDDPAAYKPLLTADPDERDLKNRRLYSLDLTPYAQQNGSVSVRFEDVSTQDGWGPWVMSVTLKIGGKLAASFRTGSEIETRFLVDDHNSQFNGEGRFADKDAYWTYRFDNLPKNTPIELVVDMGNGFLVKARSSGPRDPLLEAADKTFERTLSRLRIPRAYPITLYTPPAGAKPLYAIGGQPAMWEVGYGKGTAIFSGVAPGYLTASEQSSRWARAIARHATEKAGGKYGEQAYLRVDRGPFTAVRALGKEYTADGWFVDLLNPNLPLVEDPAVPAHGWALLEKLGPKRGAPRVAAVSGRLRARSEQSHSTAFFVQAPEKTDGTARLWGGRRKFVGVKAYTVFGSPVAASAAIEGDSVLIRYPNDPDGVIVRAGWE